MSGGRRIAGILGGVVLLSLAGSASAEPGSAVAQISISPSDGSVMIKASALGLAQVDVSGEVAIDRRGKSGSVTTRQSRTMKLRAGETGEIASVSVSFQPGDELDVALTLSENGVVIATASVITGTKAQE